VTVIAAFEFQGEVTAGKAARQANSAHASLGSRIDQTDHFDGRNSVDDQFSKFDFAAGGRAEAGAEFEDGSEGIDDRLGTVAEDERAPGTDVIDVFIAIDVEHMGAVAAGDEARSASNRAEGAHG
jgi:hypothetical protein